MKILQGIYLQRFKELINLVITEGTLSEDQRTELRNIVAKMEL